MPPWVGPMDTHAVGTAAGFGAVVVAGWLLAQGTFEMIPWLVAVAIALAAAGVGLFGFSVRRLAPADA